MAGPGSRWRELTACRNGRAKDVVMALALALLIAIASADRAVARQNIGSHRRTRARSLRLEIQPEVTTTNITLGSGNDTFEGYVVKPGDGRVKAVTILLPDVKGIPGKGSREFAVRLSSRSRYAVVVPDLFRGNPLRQDAATFTLEDFAKWLAGHPANRVAGDIDKTISYAVQTYGKLPLGILGFCFGGGKVMSTLGRDRGANIKAGVSFYGAPLNVTDAVNIRAPILVILGGNDSFVDPEPYYEAKELMDSAPSPVPSKIIIYQNSPHAFAHDIQPGQEKNARRAFRAMRLWFRRYLKA